MKRNHNLRKLKAKKSYSTLELAEALDVHVQTIRGWRKNGLHSIDETSHFSLYLGSSVQIYLKEQMENRRVTLSEGEFYCLSCRRGTTALNIIVVSQYQTLGSNKTSVRIEGTCARCRKKVNKFDTRELKDLVTAQVINTGSSSSL
jgi:hypothetical protein